MLDADCQPIAGALLDFWQADAAGVYDNEGDGHASPRRTFGLPHDEYIAVDGNQQYGHKDGDAGDAAARLQQQLQQTKDTPFMSVRA